MFTSALIAESRTLQLAWPDLNSPANATTNLASLGAYQGWSGFSRRMMRG